MFLHIWGKGSPPGFHFQIRQSPAAQQLGHLPPPWAWAPPSSASSRRLPRLPTGDRWKKREDQKVMIIHYHTLSYYLSVQESKLETFSTALHQLHHTSEDELELFFLFFPITGGSTKHVHRPPPNFWPLQPNGKRSHDHSLKSWEHPWAIHNKFATGNNRKVFDLLSMRFPRNLVSPLLSVPAASASIFTRARRHPRSATPAALMSEIQELRFELFTARLLLARVAVHHGSTPKIPIVGET